MTKRSRLVEWEDPARFADALRELTGLEFIRAILSGSLPAPPIAETLGYAPAAADNGRTVFTLEPAEYLLNPINTVHGGVVGALLDTAMASAVQTALPREKVFTTLEFKVNFIRPVTERTGTVTAVGECVSLGARTATAKAEIRDGLGRLIAHGTSTCMILELDVNADGEGQP